MIATIVQTLAPAARDLTRLDAVKAELGIADAAQDAWLTDAIRQASDAIAAFCRRPEGFGRATWTETFRFAAGRAEASLLLARDLAPAITSVTEDGIALDPAEYLLDGSILRRLQDDAPAPWQAAKVVVVYQAGWALLAELPYDVERCCLDLVVRAHQAKGRDPGLRSERILDVIAQSWDTPGGDGFKDGLPRDVAERLGPYIRWAV
ncbi:MAG: phage head-tail connector protein [Azospirillum sp.]|nr:phage head-tail connector protein [Azospirillum sp.]MCA3268495.1 phage head-tail connector protein [Azospirillum sp.]